MSSPVAKPTRGSTANKAGRRGRKPGSGSIDDTQLLHRMLRLLAKEDARSVYAAAKAVAPTIAGQSRDAIVYRLRKKFKAIFGTSPPAGKTWFDVERELGEKWI
jgi:hypothetical protein